MEKLLFWLPVILLGIAYGCLIAGIQSTEQQNRRRNRIEIVVAISIFAVLLAGLLLSGYVKNETMSFLFGIGLMLALPAIVVFAISCAVGKSLIAFVRERKK
ncbi:hypothetical protein [Variovorax sp. PCZ-1]|uniref:hypothetical protein n=1 Tax=Variovorax sp. PCZ-1 TaxID=2835533 RepID=UPI001BD1177C|nr:hypothetical protein [Variovorax sp. PCZ-1]MBS7808138.1 hypothetical protein [Variovorax sp. PCZ-1]